MWTLVLAVLSCLAAPQSLVLRVLRVLLVLLLPEIRIHSKLAVRREGAVMHS
jgi:hypothetical protein